MNQNEKEKIYNSCLREADVLRRKISELKSEHGINQPKEIEDEILKHKQRMVVLENQVKVLF